jgi:hypothetical protein
MKWLQKHIIATVELLENINPYSWKSWIEYEISKFYVCSSNFLIVVSLEVGTKTLRLDELNWQSRI